MTWVLGQQWIWALVSFLLGLGATLWLLHGHGRPQPAAQPNARPAGRSGSRPPAARTQKRRPAKGAQRTQSAKRSGASKAGADAPATRRSKPAAVPPARRQIGMGDQEQGPLPDERASRRDRRKATPSIPAAPEMGGHTADSVGPYGAGSVAIRLGDAAPEGYPVKGDIETQLFYPPYTRRYEGADAEVCFTDEATAIAAGFLHADPRRRS
ncbi:hypothetical protein ACMYYO_00875 [Dermacoccaceae bacterium W4C1]